MWPKKALYKQIAKEGGGGVNSACSWMDADKEELEELKNGTITMTDTAWGHYKAEMKRDTICRTPVPVMEGMRG